MEALGYVMAAVVCHRVSRSGKADRAARILARTPDDGGMDDRLGRAVNAKKGVDFAVDQRTHRTRGQP